MMDTNVESFSPTIFSSNLLRPDVYDHVHFSNSFFFLAIFVGLLWWMYIFSFTAKYSETTELVKESRGFSRAQTGDLFTAVIPLTWSLSMIMHAGSNSSNFDENTDGCETQLNIIAYQWGWNYFIPADTLDLNFNPIINKTMNINGSDFSYYDLFNNNFSENQKNDNIGLNKVVFDYNYNINNIGFDYNDNINNIGFDYNDNINNIGFDYNIVKNFKNIKNLGTNNFSSYNKFYNVNFEISNKFLLEIVDYNKFFNKNLQKTLKVVIPLNYIDVDSMFEKQNKQLELNSSRAPFKDNIFKKTIDLSNYNSNILMHRYSINNGIILPSDTPLHIICGSKDVIHSWAIPGLMIKIDCIPGYNCHRRLVIRWQGVYWGQCMEVCGRYHHWMPILVKVTNNTFFYAWLNSMLNN